MFSAQESGSGDLEGMLKKAKDISIFNSLSRYGQEGVAALAAATPVKTGLTASSWTYEIVKERNSWSIVWGNTHIVDGTPVVVLLQHGHGTGTGGYVQGRDFINPAIRPIFERIANDAWKAVNA